MDFERDYGYLAFLIILLALMFITFITFLILKLTYVISWGWLWVFSPLWIGELINMLSLTLIWVYYLLAEKRGKE